MQDALLDEEGATPADGFSGDANAVSLRLPQAKAETKQRMQTAEEAHEVSTPPVLRPSMRMQQRACWPIAFLICSSSMHMLAVFEGCMSWSRALCTLHEGTAQEYCMQHVSDCGCVMHQAAIFGKSCSSALPQVQPEQDTLPGMQGGLGFGAVAFTRSPEAGELHGEPDGTKPLHAGTLVADSVVNAQPGLSWRERAALKRKQLAGQ